MNIYNNFKLNLKLGLVFTQAFDGENICITLLDFT